MNHNIETTSYDIDWGNLTVSGTGMVNNGSIQGYNGTSNTDFWTSAIDYGSISISEPNQSGKLVLKGESADIEINGESLNETLQAIKDALRIPNRIQRNDKLEAEFEELKQLREQYESRMKEYQEMMKTWDILKKE
jgi:hypothetical protein